MDLKSYIGQVSITNDLIIHIENSLITNYPLEHVMLYGKAGLGKTTLVEVIAYELGSEVIQKTGQEVNKETIHKLLSDIGNNNILFLDEIHNTPTKTMEILYGPLQIINNVKLNQSDISPFIFEGIKIEPFTLIGATTAPGMIAKPLRDRMILNYQLQPYPNEDLETILRMKGCPKYPAKIIAQRSRGTPRLALNYFLRIRNESGSSQEITEEICYNLFKRQEIDDKGFTAEDRRIIEYLFDNGTASENELYKSLGIDKSDFQNMYEPFLLENGLLRTTSKGRALTAEGSRYAKEMVK